MFYHAIVINNYNLSVINQVFANDKCEIVKSAELNSWLKMNVTRILKLPADIDAIMAEIVIGDIVGVIP